MVAPPTHSPRPGKASFGHHVTKAFHENRGLLLMKFVLFTWFSSSYPTWTYMPLILRNLGITVQQAALIYAVFPVATGSWNTLAGFVADKIGRYKPIILFCAIASAIIFNVILLLPAHSQNNVTFNLTLAGDVLSLTPSCDSTCPNELNLSSYRWSECNVTSRSMPALTSLEEGQCRYRLTNGTDLPCPGSHLVSDSVCGVDSSTFAIVFLLVIVGFSFNSTPFTQYDACAYSMIKGHKSSYGKYRMVAMMGRLICVPLVGFLVDIASNISGRPNFLPVLILLDVQIVIVVILTFFLDTKVDSKTQKNMWKQITVFIRRPQAQILLLSCFGVGTGYGFINTFMLWHLRDIGGSASLMGLCNSVATTVALPFMFFGEKIISRVGEVNAVTFAFIAYAVRFSVLYLLWNPWWAILSESVCEVFCFHLFSVCTSNMAEKMVGKNLRVTVQTSIRVLHYNGGRLAASALGWVLVGRFGLRSLWLVVAGIMIVCGTLYVVVNRLCPSNSSQHEVLPASDESNGRVPKEDEGEDEVDEPFRKRNTSICSATDNNIHP